FISGSEIEQNVVLTNIDIQYNNGPGYIRSYELEYDLGFYTRLEQVTVSDGQGNHFNPTKFEWGVPSSVYSTLDANFDVDYNYINGDYNGDGKTDYVRIPKEITWVGESNLELFLNRGNGVFESTYSAYLPYEYTYLHNYEPGGFVKNSFDFNGDGKGDLIIDAAVYMEYPDVPEDGEYRRIDVFLSTGTTLSDNPVSSFYLDLHKDVESFQFGDFNGDLITDVFLLFSDRSWKLHKGSENIGHNTVAGTDLVIAGYDLVNADDYNGDGKADLLLTAVNGCEIYEINDPESDFTTLVSLFTSGAPGYPTSSHELFHGDFNGDGITDVLSWNEQTGWELKLFTGKTWDWNNNYAPDLVSLATGGNPPHFFKIADFNGDGKDDIFEIYQKNWGQNQHDIVLYYSTGLDFLEEAVATINYGSYTAHEYGVGNFNGDGYLDL
ncbi:MAG: VCBS repeat-containing protein, partial [Chlorobiales bacterium]|nr:VCBS repeat-containing protein [Chlorobiales bacterium]